MLAGEPRLSDVRRAPEPVETDLAGKRHDLARADPHVGERPAVEGCERRPRLA
jgi:hypothetical protein